MFKKKKPIKPWCGWNGKYIHLHTEYGHATTDFHKEDGSFKEIETCPEMNVYRITNETKNPKLIK